LKAEKDAAHVHGHHFIEHVDRIILDQLEDAFRTRARDEDVASAEVALRFVEQTPVVLLLRYIDANVRGPVFAERSDQILQRRFAPRGQQQACAALSE